jgi:predicted metal-dependent peptidase
METNPAVDARAKEMLVLSRVSLLMHEPFFGNIATRLKLVNADEWCDTAATDGRFMYYNSEFVSKLKQEEVTFLVGHEILHVIFDHLNRSIGLIEEVSDLAADYAVNDACIEYNLGKRIDTCLYDVKYHGWSFEQIYEDLLKKPKSQIQTLLEKLIDDHMNESSSNSKNKGKDDGGKRGKMPVLSAQERAEISDEIKEAILSAVQAVGAGKVPAGMRRFVDSLTESKMDWRQILTMAAESQIKNDFSYMKPSRRGWSCDAVLPSMMKEPCVELDAALDMSGSIGQTELNDFFGEIVGIMEQYRSFKIGIFTFDTTCYNYKVFTQDNINEIEEYIPQGGGGTDFNCIYEFLKNNDIVPKQLVIFTDMMCGTWGDPEYCDTIWLAHKSSSIAPHGTTVEYS